MISLARATGLLVGKPYRLGSFAADDGLDCFSMVIHYLKYVGVRVPNPMKYGDLMGVDFNNYGKAYDADPERTVELGARYLKRFLKEVEPSLAAAGDVLQIILVGRSIPAFAIDGGNGNCVSSVPGEGVMTLHKKDYIVKGAFRWERR